MLRADFSRGGESDYTLVLVDGIRANSFGGGLDLSQVPLQDVERAFQHIKRFLLAVVDMTRAARSVG